jgi:hypothetical protein
VGARDGRLTLPKIVSGVPKSGLETGVERF